MLIKKLDKKRNVIKPFLYFLFLIIICYAIFYLYFINPLFKLHQLQSKEWITDLTKTMVLGVNDLTLYKNIDKSNTQFISFWYCYWYFHTKQYTIWILFILKNKFTDAGIINFYVYDFQNSNLIIEEFDVRLSNLKTIATNNDKLVIHCEGAYYQEIDFKNNKSFIKIKTNKIQFELNVNIDDYTTNQAAFLPRYQFLTKFMKNNGEWMSDNPLIGKIENGMFNVSIQHNGEVSKFGSRLIIDGMYHKDEYMSIKHE